MFLGNVKILTRFGGEKSKDWIAPYRIKLFSNLSPQRVLYCGLERCFSVNWAALPVVGWTWRHRYWIRQWMFHLEPTLLYAILISSKMKQSLLFDHNLIHVLCTLISAVWASYQCVLGVCLNITDDGLLHVGITERDTEQSNLLSTLHI